MYADMPDVLSVEKNMNYRAIWISDVHLGTKHSQVNKLLEFLRDTECDYLYIVGDFIDGWQLRRKWFWADEYNVLIQKLLRKNSKRTRVTFITGNHDEFLEKFFGITFGSVRLVERAVHTAADGKRYLVIHGPPVRRPDAFQPVAGPRRLGALRPDFGPERLD